MTVVVYAGSNPALFAYKSYLYKFCAGMAEWLIACGCNPHLNRVSAVVRIHLPVPEFGSLSLRRTVNPLSYISRVGRREVQIFGEPPYILTN